MAAEADSKAAEMVEIVREIQRRVRERYPQGNLEGAAIELPDLLRILQARDAAEAKVAAIGTVNPRPPGLLNYLAQKLKRAVARALDWHIREQIEFNRAAVSAIQATLDAMNDYNRALAGLHTEMQRQFEEFFSKLEAELPAFREEVRELKDVRTHWSQWRQEWERKLSVNEVQFLRSVADLQAAFQHRVTLMESNFRGIVEAQHSNYEGALSRSGSEIQGRLWADLERIRLEYERLIHNELRVVRQRLAAAPAAAQELAPPVDALKFADRFRGVEEHVRMN